MALAATLEELVAIVTAYLTLREQSASPSVAQLDQAHADLMEAVGYVSAPRSPLSA